jgi:hypothetical protein
MLEMNDPAVKSGGDIERVPKNSYLHRIRFFFTDRYDARTLERTELICSNDIAVLHTRRYFRFKKTLPVKRPYSISGYRFCTAVPEP